MLRQDRFRFDAHSAVTQEPLPTVPTLASGLTVETFQTSEAAAVEAEPKRARQRRLVFEAIKRAGAEGRTDDELQQELQLDGSSERPRRWELWKLDRITIRHDEHGRPVRRETRTKRAAVVWVAA